MVRFLRMHRVPGTWLAPWLMLAGLSGLPAQADTVVYPRTESHTDRRDEYPIKLLTLALSKSGQSYTLQASPHFMLQGRALAEVAAGRSLDVAWTMTTEEREAALRPIRIPIDKGLLGWRLLLVRQADVPRFAGVRSPDQLRRLVAGQGHDWPDTAILRHSGYRVETTAIYQDLFVRLGSGRVAYFPRSVQEVWHELALHADQHLAVEPTLALHYPTAMYFFVSRANTTLAAAIEKGLSAAQADGSFDRLFRSYFGEDIARAHLAQRRVVELPNPLLPKATPLDQPGLWLRVSDDTRP